MVHCPPPRRGPEARNGRGPRTPRRRVPLGEQPVSITVRGSPAKLGLSVRTTIPSSTGVMQAGSTCAALASPPGRGDSRHRAQPLRWQRVGMAIPTSRGPPQAGWRPTAIATPGRRSSGWRHSWRSLGCTRSPRDSAGTTLLLDRKKRRVLRTGWDALPRPQRSVSLTMCRGPRAGAGAAVASPAQVLPAGTHWELDGARRGRATHLRRIHSRPELHEETRRGPPMLVLWSITNHAAGAYDVPSSCNEAYRNRCVELRKRSIPTP